MLSITEMMIFDELMGPTLKSTKLNRMFATAVSLLSLSRIEGFTWCALAYVNRLLTLCPPALGPRLRQSPTDPMPARPRRARVRECVYACVRSRVWCVRACVPCVSLCAHAACTDVCVHTYASMYL